MTEHHAAQSRPSAQSPAPAEQPSTLAELKISVSPASKWGSASGMVPPDDARRFVVTLGILGSVFIGIGGAVLTLRVVSGTTGVALAVAELAVALVGAVLISATARISRRRSP